MARVRVLPALPCDSLVTSPMGYGRTVRGKPPTGVDVAEGTPGNGGAQGGRNRIPYRITRRYASTMTQVVARLDDDLVAAVDELVSEGLFESRSDAIRRALEFVVDCQRRKRIGMPSSTDIGESHKLRTRSPGPTTPPSK